MGISGNESLRLRRKFFNPGFDILRQISIALLVFVLLFCLS